MAPGKTQVARAAAGEERSKRNEPVTVKEKPLKIKTDAVLGSEFERKDLKRSYDKFSKIPRPPQSKNLKTHQARPLSPNPASKPIKKKPSRMIQQPDLPNEYTDIITAKNGCELKLIIQKKLFKTDLEKDANRLSIPNGQLKAEFLGQKEHIILQEKVGGHYKGIKVPLIQPCLEVSTILKKKMSQLPLTTLAEKLNSGLKCKLNSPAKIKPIIFLSLFRYFPTLFSIEN